MAASETVRLRLQFDYPPPATPHCTVFWLLVDLNRCRVVTDLISLIRQRFGFSSGALLGLYLEGGLLPPVESARLVRDNDCLRVKLEDRGSPESAVAVGHGGDSPFTRRRARKRAFRLVENEEVELSYRCSKRHWKRPDACGHSDRALDAEPRPGPEHAGRKKMKGRTASAEGSADGDQDEGKGRSRRRREKSECKKNKSAKPPKARAAKEWALQNGGPPKGSPRSSPGKARKKGKPGAAPPKRSPSSESESESCQETPADDGACSVTVNVVTSADKLPPERLQESPPGPSPQAPGKGKAARAESCSSDSSLELEDPMEASKSAAADASGVLRTGDLFSGRGCPGPGLAQGRSPAPWKPLSPGSGRQTPGPPPAVPVPTNLGRGWGRGEDLAPWKGPRGRAARGRGRGNGSAFSSLLNRSAESQKQRQLSERVTTASTFIQNPVELPKKDYSVLPLLAAAPQVGEKIAFKLLELTSDYSPDVSDYKEGKILSHNPETQQVDIEILSSLPDFKEPGKFDLVYHNENGTEVVEYAVTQERRISVLWKELIDPRLMIESASTDSSTELV